MLHKTFNILVITLSFLSLITDSTYGNSRLIDKAELASTLADAEIVGIDIPSEITDLHNQLKDLASKRLEKAHEISIASNTYTPQSFQMKQLKSELAEFDNKIIETENKLLKAGIKFSLEIDKRDQEIENLYIEAKTNYKPETSQFKEADKLYSASKRLRQKYQTYQVLYQARKTLSLSQSTVFDCIEAYARVLFIDPGNKEAIEYCQNLLISGQSEKSDYVLDNISQLSNDTILTLYNNGVNIIKNNELDIELSWVPPGSYTKPTIDYSGMMKQKATSNIIITKGFWMSSHEITVSQFLEYLNSTRTFDQTGHAILNTIEKEPLNFELDRYNCYQLTNDLFLGNPDKPMIMVSYQEALNFCQWLSELDGSKYSLPTEAQWELAARATFDTEWYFGNDISLLDQYGWYGKLSRISTEETGKLKPNLFGLYDMYGNVWEWCLDWYSDPPYPAGSNIDPVRKRLSNTKVIRGGSWQSKPASCSSSGRNSATPEVQDKAIGFRIIQTIN